MASMASLTSPRLTTLRVDLNALGAKAMNVLLGLIENDSQIGEQVVVQPELVIRESA